MEKSQVTALRETPDFLVLFYGQIFHPILQEIASLQAAPLVYRFITTEKSRSGSHEILRAAVLTVFIKQPRINIGCDVSEITQNDPWKAITFSREGRRLERLVIRVVQKKRELLPVANERSCKLLTQR